MVVERPFCNDVEKIYQPLDSVPCQSNLQVVRTGVPIWSGL